MASYQTDDAVNRRIRIMVNRVDDTKDAGLYFYNQPISELRGGARVLVGGVKWVCMPLIVIWV